ncbi:MAG TPA: ABC transporter substrate-binding protein, partial [Dehalococcoidia bacterium]|nr:ABC transporter substrate-binding protein [Dehalococcoidia bacterium]
MADTAQAAEPTAAPVVGETAQPTATPQMAAPPADVEVNPGKVTWMTAVLGDERFDAPLSTGGGDYHRLFHAYLLGSDVAEGRRVIAPGIARKWEMSGDGRTWTLTVGRGAKFHDGKEVTVEDVQGSLQRAIGPQAKDYTLNSAAIALSNIVDGIEQTAPDQVSVIARSPIVEFPQQISDSQGGSPGIVMPKRATLHDEEVSVAYDNNPIGAGLMRLVNHVPADVMTFERFEDYYHQPKNGFAFDQRVNFTAFDLRLVPEESTRAAALRAGEVDIAPVSLATKAQVEAGGGRLVFGQEGVIFEVTWLGCWKPQFPCSDKRVRQALQYAIDKELMRDTLYGGPEVMQVKGWARVTPSVLGYSPELDPFPFDPDKGRQLMADAGYPGGTGFGKLVVNTHVGKSMPFLPESAQLVASMWEKELGLDVEVRVGDYTAQQEASKLTEDFHGQLWWRDNNLAPDASKIIKKGDDWGGGPQLNVAHRDPELTALAAETAAVL